MPSEYKSGQSGPAAPTPSAFGSQPMQLDNPQFQAQVGFKQTENPFEQLQGVLKSAVGVTGQYLENKTNVYKNQVATKEAEYQAKQRAYAEQNRIERDATEDAVRSNTQNNTMFNGWWSRGMFDEVDRYIEEQLKTETRPQVLNALSEAKLEGQQRRKVAEHEAETKADDLGKQFIPALYNQVDQAGEDLVNVAIDSINKNEPTIFDGVDPDQLSNTIQKTIRGKLNSETFSLLSPEQQAHVEAKIHAQVDRLSTLASQSRQRQRDLIHNRELSDQLAGLPVVIQTIGVAGYDEFKTNVDEAVATRGLHESRARELKRQAAVAYGERYLSHKGFVGSLQAASEVSAAVQSGSMTGPEGSAAMQGVRKRLESDVKLGIDRIIATATAANGDSPTNALATSSELASKTLANALGTTEEELLRAGFGDEMAKLNAQQGRAVEAKEREEIANLKAYDVQTVLGYDTAMALAETAALSGDNSQMKALVAKFDEDMILHKDNPVLLKNISKRRLDLLEQLADTSAEVKMMRSEVDNAMRESLTIGMDEPTGPMIDEELAASTARVNAPIKAMDDKLAAMAEQYKGDPSMTQAIAQERLVLVGKASRNVAGKDSRKIRHKMASSEDIWESWKRLSPQMSQDQQKGFFRQIFAQFKQVGQFHPAAIAEVEKLAKDPGNGELVMDLMHTSGALYGQQATTADFRAKAPVALTAALLLEADTNVTRLKGMEVAPGYTRETYDTMLKQAEGIVNDQSSAFNLSKKDPEVEGPQTTRPLEFNAQLTAGLEKYAGLTGVELNDYSLSVDDKAAFDVFYRKGLQAFGGDSDKAIDFATKTMVSTGYTAVRTAGNKVDFVQDIYRLVPEDLTDPDTIRAAQDLAMVYLRNNYPEYSGLKSSAGLQVDIVIDDRYLGVQATFNKGIQSGVPFNITTPSGKVINYTDRGGGPVPLINREWVEAKKSQYARGTKEAKQAALQGMVRSAVAY